jgi:hypothetical protein
MYPNSFLAIQKQDGWNVVKQIRDEEWKARTQRREWELDWREVFRACMRFLVNRNS